MNYEPDNRIPSLFTDFSLTFKKFSFIPDFSLTLKNFRLSLTFP